MKRIVLFVILLTIIFEFFSCKKDIPVSDSLNGTWELRVDVNGLSGAATYHKAGNDTLVKFGSNTYAFYQKNKLVGSGTYTFKKDTFSLDHTLKNRIIYKGETDNFIWQFFEIKNNQLTFFIDAYDAPSVTYQRMK